MMARHYMVKSRSAALAFVAAGAAFIAADSASVVAAAGKTETVIFASGFAAPFVHYIAAVDNGLTEAQGIQAEYKLFPSGAEAIIAVGAGEAHVSNGSCSQALLNRANGSDIVVVARNLINPAEHGVAVTADIQKPQDLVGKKVAVLRGSSGDWFRSRYFSHHGLTEGDGPEDVQVITLAAPEWIPAVQTGEIVGFFGWEPWLTRMPEIIAGSHVLNRSNDDDVFTLHNCLMFNGTWVRSDPESAEAAIRSLIAANDWIQANKQAAADLASSPMRIPAEELGKMVDIMTYTIDFTPDFVDHIRDGAAWLSSTGTLDVSDPDALIAELLHPDLLKRVAPDRVSVN